MVQGENMQTGGEAMPPAVQLYADYAAVIADVAVWAQEWTGHRHGMLVHDISAQLNSIEQRGDPLQIVGRLRVVISLGRRPEPAPRRRSTGRPRGRPRKSPPPRPAPSGARRRAGAAPCVMAPPARVAAVRRGFSEPRAGTLPSVAATACRAGSGA